MIILIVHFLIHRHKAIISTNDDQSITSNTGILAEFHIWDYEFWTDGHTRSWWHKLVFTALMQKGRTPWSIGHKWLLDIGKNKLKNHAVIRCVVLTKEEGIANCHSISFSGPMYMVQHAEIKIIIHPTNLPKDGMILDEPIPRNCDSTIWNTKHIIQHNTKRLQHDTVG